MDSSADAARTLWSLFEPVHAVTYFAPEARAAFEDAGLRGFWRGYFAARTAPFGTAGPEQVRSAFYSFAPGMVERSLPSVWEQVRPRQALAVRRSGARAALTRLLAGRDEAVARAADLLEPYARGLDVVGRPLAAANCALPWPDTPHERLWHAATLLREHRGDGHVSALVCADLDGCEILVLRAGSDLPRAELQPYRGWSDEDWAAAAARLADRDLLTPEGRATPAGRDLLAAVETATDRAARRPWSTAAPTALRELSAVLAPLAHGCAGALRFPNPIGLPAPGTAD